MSSVLFKSELGERDCITGLLNFLLKRWQLKNNLHRFIQHGNSNVSEDLLVSIFSQLLRFKLIPAVQKPFGMDNITSMTRKQVTERLHGLPKATGY